MSEVTPTRLDRPLEGGPYSYEFSLIPLGPTNEGMQPHGVPFHAASEPMQAAVKPISLFVPCIIDTRDWVHLLEQLTQIKFKEIAGFGDPQCMRLLKLLDAEKH